MFSTTLTYQSLFLRQIYGSYANLLRIRLRSANHCTDASTCVDGFHSYDFIAIAMDFIAMTS